MLLENKVAFVTGAGSGIGAAEAIARDIRVEGFCAEAMQVDVTDDKALVAAITAVTRKTGRLDVLHSHAGIQIEGNLEQVAVADMDASWALNVRAHFLAAQAAVTPMRAQGGGSIIITSSNSGVQYDREMIAYATTNTRSWS